MFGKLLKYDLKSVGKWYFALNAALLIISILLGFGLKPLFEYAEDTYTAGYNMGSSLLLLVLMLSFGVLIAGTLISTMVIIVRRFYTNVFGREGYLTLTLPVSTHQILLSKVLSSLIWTIFNFFILGVSIFLLVLPIIGVDKLLIAAPLITQKWTVIDFFTTLVYVILSAVAGVLLIYLAISVGQLFTNKRTLMAFVAYFTFGILFMVLSSLIGNHIFADDDIFSRTYLIYYSIDYLLRIVIAYSVTYYIIKNKLNIQ